MRARSIPILFTLLLSNLLAACGDNGHVAPDAPPGPTTIGITVDQPPALVAFRDGLFAPWQPATERTSTSSTWFEAQVHGPYVVTVVCEDPAGRSRTWQLARTPDDAHHLGLTCDLPPALPPIDHQITGHMMQPGHVYLGSSSDTSLPGETGWDFQISAPSGSYVLIATTDDWIAMRRTVVVDGDLGVQPDIDVTQEGTKLVDAAFTASTAEGETLDASVDLLTPTTLFPGRVYLGPAATAKILGNPALQGDTQLVTVRATSGTARRELRRSFRVGYGTEYTLPQPLGDVRWTEPGPLSASWTTLPQLDSLDLSASSSAADGTTVVQHNLDMTPLFLAETGIQQIAIDTEIPNYDAAWKIDFTGRYTRALTAQRTMNDDLATSSVTETVNAP
jgi:hypothetical protein